MIERISDTGSFHLVIFQPFGVGELSVTVPSGIAKPPVKHGAQFHAKLHNENEE